MAQDIIRTVSFEGQTIDYVLERKEVKNLNLRIRKDCSVYVSANSNVPINKVDEFIKSKANYIVASQNKFRLMAEYAPAPKQYISGESFYVLGRELRLKLIESKKEQIYSDGVYLFLCVKDVENFKRKEKLVNKYLDNLCMDVFGQVIETIYPIFKKYGVAYPNLRIRNMETRWGSCLSKKGIITLNKKLLETPRNCIEYVVMHEFCHFIHPNHSRNFYALLTMLMPDWKDRKAILEKSATYGL